MHNCKEARLKYEKCNHDTNTIEHSELNCTEIFDTYKNGIVKCDNCYEWGNWAWCKMALDILSDK